MIAAVTPLDALAVSILLAAALAVGRWRAGARRRPKRARHDDPMTQLDADFPAEHRAEAKRLVEAIAARARPQDRELVRRHVVDAVRGDIGKLRRSAPKAADALDRVNRLLPADDAPDAEP